MKVNSYKARLTLSLIAVSIATYSNCSYSADSIELPSVSNKPLFLTGAVPALVMLVMGRDHTLFSEAYNDATDLNNNGVLESKETRFDPSTVYYGYFDSYKCYKYESNTFKPTAYITATDIANTNCSGETNGGWSGNFLNYVTTSRIDALRKALYGGLRTSDAADTSGATLQGSYVPPDAHAWGKSYDPFDPKQKVGLTQAFSISKFAPFSDSDKLFFARINTRGQEPAIRVLNLSKIYAKGWMSEADYKNMRVWSWAGSGMPVARTQLMLPEVNSGTGEKGKVYQIKEKCSGNEYGCSINDFPDVSSNDSPDKYDSTTLTQYYVNVEVCNSSLITSATFGKTEQCSAYKDKNSNTIYKPTGLLHEYATSKSAEFGLITGSYNNNKQGGVLRRNIADFSKEINSDGTINVSINGIIKNLNALKIIDFDDLAVVNRKDRDPWLYYDGFKYNNNECGDNTFVDFANGKCRNWGNPIGEMLSEAMRYFYQPTSTAPTENYKVATGSDGINTLTQDSWLPAFSDSASIKGLTINGKLRPYCAPAVNLLISNTNVSFDGDNVQLPDGKSSSDWAGFADTIGAEEGLDGNSFFFGRNTGNDTEKNMPTAKTLSTLSKVRGSVSEPSKEGSYSAAGLAYFGNITNIFSGKSQPSIVKTMAIAMATPLPEIKIKAMVEGKDKIVTLVPYAKSVKKWQNGGAWGSVSTLIDPTDLGSTPTSEMIDFYVDEITPTSGKFTVNYADREQGGDYDSDMVATYQYTVSGDQITVTVTSESASGDIEQHAGFVISGTTEDKLYLVVRDVPDCNKDKTSNWGSEGNIKFSLDTGSNLLPPYLTGAGSGGSNCKNKQGGYSYTKTFTASSKGSAANYLKNPLWYASRWGSYKSKPTAAVGGTKLVPDSVTSESKPDGYFPVYSANDIAPQLNDAISRLDEREYTQNAVASSDYILTDSSQMISSYFVQAGWKGDVISRKWNTDGTVSSTIQWNAATQLDAVASAATRTVYTASGKQFTASSLTDEQYKNLAIGAGGVGLSDALKVAYGKNIVDYLRGDRTYETQAEPNSGVKLRTRSSRLGDIVNSSPSYGVDKNGKKFVIIGANDGMAHIFNADTGAERFAYVPGILLADTKLGAYASQSYSHQFYVDGDIRIDTRSDNKMMAVGSLGLGGRGIYALDVSDVSSMGATNTLWEFTDNAMGYYPAAPDIVKLKNADASALDVVVMGNGYNAPLDASSNRPKGRLYVINAKTGVLIKAIETTAKSGLSEPAVLDEDGDGYADVVYAGDLAGNVWRFLISSTQTDTWSSTKIFSTGKPITSRPIAQKHGSGGLMVYFGTGKYLETTDPENKDVQSVYGIWDKSISDTSATAEVTLASLQQQEVKEENAKRQITATGTINWNDKKGWFFNLPVSGERVIANPEVSGSKLNILTMFPTSDSDAECGVSGKGWIMELDGINGRAYSNGTEADRQNSNRLADGIMSNLEKIVTTTPDNKLKKKSKTQLHTLDTEDITNPPDESSGTSWKQLY